MKNVWKVLIVAAFVAAFALPAFAQNTAGQTPAAGPCTTEAETKAALYQKFRDNFKGTPDQQKIAYDSAKEYLSKYGNCTGEGDPEITKYVQGWVAKYEKAVRDFACTDAYSKKDYAKAFQACQVILDAEPENLDTVLLLVGAGYANAASATPNASLNPQALRVMRRAVDLISADKAPTKWETPFTNKQEALGFLYYAQGVLTQETDPTASAAAFIKAAQSNSSWAHEASTYTYLATIYETNELKKLVDQYSQTFPPNVPIPDEKKDQYNQMVFQISKVQDRIIDAEARAYAIMKADPKADQKVRTAVLNKLTNYYKVRHEDKEDGLQELISSIMSKPLMLPGQEPTTPPASSSSSVTGTDGAVKPAATTTTTPANGAKPAATTPATTPATGTKPAPKPQSKTTTKPAAKVAAKTTSGR